MSANRDIEQAIGQYLEKVAAELQHMPADEKDAVLASVESHIYESLRRVGADNPTLVDLKTVLANMAPPSSYGEKAGGSQSEAPEVEAQQPRLCRWAMAGALTTVVTLGFFIGVLNEWWETAGRQERFVGGFEAILHSWVMIVSIFFVPAAICVSIGLKSIYGIRASKGRLGGLPLAVGATVMCPFLIADAAAYFLIRAFFDELSMPSSGVLRALFKKPLPECVGLLAILAVDLIIVRKIWMWARRRGPAPVLAETAPLSSYGAKASAVAQPSVTARSERKLCKQPIVAAFWAPFGVAAFLMATIAVPVPAGTQWPPLWYKILMMGIVLPLGVAAPFATTALGLIGISRVRSSKGSLTGMPLAVAASLFYPMVVFNVAVWYVSQAVAGAVFESGKIANLFILAMLVLSVIVSVVAFVKIWHWATRPLKEGEFT